MQHRLLAASAAALMLIAAPLTHAQPASAPAPMAMPAPAAAAPAAAAKATTADGAEGKVAHYGRKFNGRKTASGERFNAGAMTMAHKTLPFGTMVKVTNIKNNKSVVVRVNDRGPSQPDRMGDLTTAAARKIGMIKSGTAQVRFDVVGNAKARKSMKATGR